LIKYSHAYVGIKVADWLELQGVKKFALIIGNIVPDYLPSCFYFPHTFDNWWKYFNGKRYLLRFRRKTVLYYYNLGKEMHLCADFFTRPHNQKNMIKFLSGHGKWERQLNKKLINNGLILCDCKLNLLMLHDEYIDSDVSVDNDVLFISMAISSLLNKL
jgi:hypothetical protein